MGKKLIVKKANFYFNALEVSNPNYTRYLLNSVELLKGYANSRGSANRIVGLFPYDLRAQVVIPRDIAIFPDEYGTEAGLQVSFIPLDPYVKTISFTLTNSAYSFGVNVVSDRVFSGDGKKYYDSGWKKGTFTANVELYKATDGGILKYLNVAIKKDDNTAIGSDVTLASLGITIEAGY